MTSELEAASKATEEVARSAGKAIDAASGVGQFLERIFGAALEEAGGALRDWARYRRARNLLKLQAKYDALWARHGLTGEPLALPLKFGVPLIEAASMEEDESLQDLFAALLFNATDSRSGVETRRGFVTILQEVSALDARVLLALSQAPDANPRLYPTRTIYTAKLPDGFVTATDRTDGVLELPPSALPFASTTLPGSDALLQRESGMGLSVSALSPSPISAKLS